MKQSELEKELLELALPEVRMEGHKEVSKKRMTQLRNTPFLGIIIVTLLGMMAGAGFQNLKLFFNMPSLIYVTIIPFSLITISYGVGGLKMVFTAPFEMNAMGELKSAYITVLRDLRTYTMVSSWLGALIGIILVFNNPALIQKGMTDLLPVLGVASITVIYGNFIAFFYAYPLQKRFEHNN